MMKNVLSVDSKLRLPGMIVRIRFGSGPKIQRKRHKNQHVALALAALLTPSAAMACVLACWRLFADFNAAGQFPIESGLFSHWQVWFALAAAIQFCAIALNRYARPNVRSIS